MNGSQIAKTVRRSVSFRVRNAEFEMRSLQANRAVTDIIKSMAVGAQKLNMLIPTTLQQRGFVCVKIDIR